jgi:hypothetical protein
MDTQLATAVLCNSDLYTLIAQSLLARRSEFKDYQLVKKVLLIFGRAHPAFFQCLKRLYYDWLFAQYHAKDLNGLLKAKIKRGTPQFFPQYTALKKTQERAVAFDTLGRRQRIIVRHLSLYLGYADVFVSKYCCDGLMARGRGPYQKFFDLYGPKAVERRAGVYTLSELRAKRVHNLDHYDLVTDSPDWSQRTYRLKPDANVYYRSGAASDYHSVVCLRMIPE